MITTKLTIDLIEVMQNDVIRVRVKKSVLSDDVQVAESFEHRVIAPGNDYSGEDAKVKAVLDRTYAREMSYQIGVLNSLMQQAYNTAGPKTKQTLEDINTNLAAIAKQLANFEDAK